MSGVIRSVYSLLLITVILVVMTSSMTFYAKYSSAATNADSLINMEYCGTADYIKQFEIELNPKAQAGEDIMIANCKSCHRANTKLVGPALNTIYKKKDSVWITKFIKNAELMKKYGDRRAVRISREYMDTKHTTFTSLTKQEVNALMEYLKVISVVNN